VSGGLRHGSMRLIWMVADLSGGSRWAADRRRRGKRRLRALHDEGPMLSASGRGMLCKRGASAKRKGAERFSTKARHIVPAAQLD
jgi:hypothetical protein